MEPAKPAIVPTQVFFGLTSCKILVFPHFLPKTKAAVSQIHTEINSAKVSRNPIISKFLITLREPNIKPIQMKANMTVEIFRSGFSAFLNVSIIIVTKAKINNSISIGIFQLIPGCLLICRSAKNNINTGKRGVAPLSFTNVLISRAPKYNTTPIKIENRGRFWKLSPTTIIARREGTPMRFTSVLDDLFSVVIALNQGGKFTGTQLHIQRGYMNISPS